MVKKVEAPHRIDDDEIIRYVTGLVSATMYLSDGGIFYLRWIGRAFRCHQVHYRLLDQRILLKAFPLCKWFFQFLAFMCLVSADQRDVVSLILMIRFFCLASGIQLNHDYSLAQLSDFSSAVNSSVIEADEEVVDVIANSLPPNILPPEVITLSYYSHLIWST